MATLGFVGLNRAAFGLSAQGFSVRGSDLIDLILVRRSDLHELT